MALRGLYAAAFVGLLATGCFVESTDTRAPNGGTEIAKTGSGKTSDAEAGICRYAIGKGCFDGHVLNRKEFYVDGREFFNADDFAPRFGELISIDQGDLKLAEGETLQLTVHTKIDNDGFIDEFEYDLTGDNAFARRGSVRRTGNFSINDVPPGIYDLRVQKPIKFTVTGKVEKLTSDPANPDADPVRTVEEVSRNYCATLYQDTTVEVLKGQRAQETFSQYKLHVTDLECSAEGNQTRITLK
jgi:hypothetical protein